VGPSAQPPLVGTHGVRATWRAAPTAGEAVRLAAATVETHVGALLDELAVRDRVQLVVLTPGTGSVARG
jgi:hypothetical protein